MAPRRGYTYSASEKRDSETSGTGPQSIGFSHHLHQLQVRMSSNSSQRPRSSAGPSVPFTEAERKAIFAESRIPSVSIRRRDSTTARPPVPVLVPIVASPHLDNDLPLLPDNLHPQQTTDGIAQKVNDLVNAVTQPQAHVVVTHATDSHKLVPYSSDKQDKENQSADDEGWSHVSAEVGHSGGIGLGVGLAEGRAIGRDLVNVGPTVTKTKKDKDKKGRREYSLPYGFVSETKTAQLHHSSYLYLTPKDRPSHCSAHLLPSHRPCTIAQQQVPAGF